MCVCNQYCGRPMFALSVHSFPQRACCAVHVYQCCMPWHTAIQHRQDCLRTLFLKKDNSTFISGVLHSSSTFCMPAAAELLILRNNHAVEQHKIRHAYPVKEIYSRTPHTSDDSSSLKIYIYILFYMSFALLTLFKNLFFRLS